MSKDQDLEDVWDELLDEAPMNDGKTNTHVGIRAHFAHESSKEYIAMKSHDLHEAFDARESTDRYHKPITEAELVPRDVEEFFEDLLDGTSATAEADAPDAPPSVQLTQRSRTMIDDRVMRSHVRRQLLLWLLGIEGLKGTHEVCFELEKEQLLIEALVCDGKLCMMMKSGAKTLVDGPFERAHNALYTRIRTMLTSNKGEARGPWQRLLLPGSFEVDEAERRALMELLLRILTLAARQHLDHILPLDSTPVQIEQPDALMFDPLDFFLIADEHLQSEPHDLPSKVGVMLASTHGARGWLMHHTRPLHPFDALIAHTAHTEHSLRAASRATLLGNASRQLIEALGFVPHHTCLVAVMPDSFSMTLTDERFISAHEYPRTSLPIVMGTLIMHLGDYASLRAQDAPVDAARVHDEALDLLVDEMEECEAVILCTPRSSEAYTPETWRASMYGEECGSRTWALATKPKRARAVSAALEQFKLVSAAHHQIDTFYVFDQEHTCLIRTTPQAGHIIWVCRAEMSLGLMHAQANMNLSQWIASSQS